MSAMSLPFWLACIPLALAASSSSVSSLPESTATIVFNSTSSSPSSTLSSALPSVSLSTLSTVISATSSAASASVSPSSIFPSSTISASPSSFSSIAASSSAAAPSSAPNSSIAVPPSTGEPATQSRITIPIEPASFSPFPVPSESPVPGVFPPTDPLDPPEVNAAVVPDFEQAWAAAHEKAKATIANFTLEQKVNISTGVGWQGGLCVGNTPPVGNFPGLCLEDSPLGVRFADFVTAFPTGINAATTWNRDLIRLRGLFMGREHVGKGVNIALGPMMNMGRNAEGGRNWEGFGADPFLTGEAAYETILGMQQAGVQACAKHFINNEQEHFRTQESSDVDDRTQHEIYAQPFLKSVLAGVASVMCSYNLVNGTYACENDKMMNDILKREFGFQGFVMSDWQATESTMSAVTGLDMTMPGDITFNSGNSYFGGNLTAFVRNGTIPESRVDDMATRIIAAWFFLHQDAPTYPTTNFNAFFPDDEATNSHIDVQDDHYKLVREMGAASTVLLKNVNGALPLSGKERSLLMAGSDAGPGKIGPNEFADQGGQDGILAMGWGSGTANFTYLISPYEAIQRRARRYRTSVSWTFDDFDLDRAGNMAIQRSVALVFVNSDSGEDYITVDGNEGDRKNLTAWHGGDDLILAVAAQNNNTVVIVHSVGPLIIEPWIEHPNVTAVLWAGAPGAEAGNAITDVLYGDWNPSGKLPYTIAKDIEDYPGGIVTGGEGSEILKIVYTEGLEIDYRHFDAHNITPRFEFGFGLSYTNFSYSDLHISRVFDPDGEQDDLIQAWEDGKATPIAEGSSAAPWLHRPAFNVTFNVENTGPVYGGEIPQLYLNMPPDAEEPPSILKGFTHVEILPGETTRVSILLSRYDASIWDVVAQGWRKPVGDIGVTVGRSSRDGRLKGTLPA